jgi:DNA (cytosine-5)-methyltransferase 1
VAFSLVNAADYGVPQRRERVFIVGIRSDLGIEWSFPEKTHSQKALLWDQFISGDYWERHSMKPRRDFPGARSGASTRSGPKPKEFPWRTVRDAIRDLPDPEQGLSRSVLNHSFNPGARAYPGHTGSDYEEPAKVLKAGGHGVPGGENMLLKPDGAVRYFTVRESARLQTFPDEMVFPASWTESMRQIGNAVPCDLAQIMAARLYRALSQRAGAPASRQNPADPAHQPCRRGRRRV